MMAKMTHAPGPEQANSTVDLILGDTPVERIEWISIADRDALPAHYTVIAWRGPELVDMASHPDPLTAVTRLARHLLVGECCPDCHLPSVLFNSTIPLSLSPSARMCAIQYDRRRRSHVRLCQEAQPA